jgi:hypothetical protein
MDVRESRAEAQSVEPDRGTSTRRQTFLLQVRPDGVSTLENVGTGQRVRVDELAAVATWVERWIAEAAGETRCGKRAASSRR